MSRRASWPASLAAALLFAFSFYALQRWLERGQLSDVGGYQDYAHHIRAGHIPYRDYGNWPINYPPAALVAYLLPSYMSWSYATSFAILMGLCGAGCIALIATTLRKVGASQRADLGGAPPLRRLAARSRLALRHAVSTSGRRCSRSAAWPRSSTSGRS